MIIILTNKTPTIISHLQLQFSPGQLITGSSLNLLSFIITLGRGFSPHQLSFLHGQAVTNICNIFFSPTDHHKHLPKVTSFELRHNGRLIFWTTWIGIGRVFSHLAAALGATPPPQQCSNISPVVHATRRSATVILLFAFLPLKFPFRRSTISVDRLRGRAQVSFV